MAIASSIHTSCPRRGGSEAILGRCKTCPTKCRLSRRTSGQVAPACRSLDANGDDRIICNLHGAELRIAGTQERLRVAVFRPFVEDFGVPAQHDPAEPRPIL